jgi:glycosyltransferase involved in cell wall biosynthesis
MNMPSFHQDGLFNALSRSDEIELRVVFARETTIDRQELGWTAAARDYSHRILPDHLKIWSAVRLAWSERDRLHIVNGIWAEPSFAAALSVLGLAGSRVVVYAEAPDCRQAQTGVRAFFRRTFARWVAKRVLGFLAVSRFAEQFYTQLGFARERVYPFGYFQTPNACTGSFPDPAPAQSTEVIFVGQLIPRKGVDLLLEAIRPLFGEHPNLFLSLIGDGAESRSLQNSARALGIAAAVNFEGTVSSNRIQSRLASADVLVLPSRWDGWGMVVNEALSAGVPVIASDHCGAADLVQHGVNGYVFRSEDVEDLRGCLRRFLEAKDRRVDIRSAAANTGRAVSAESAAPYLIGCLKHMTGASSTRPIPPWTLVTASQDARH